MNWRARASLQAPSQIRFSSNDTIVHCQGAIVDIVATVPYDIRPDLDTGYTHTDFAADPMMPPTRSAKAELNRVLMSDADLETMDGLSIFDMPWYEEEAMIRAVYELDSGIEQEYIVHDKGPQRWTHIIPLSEFLRLFNEFLYPSQDFRLRGVGLRDHFASTDVYCLKPDKLDKPKRDFSGCRCGEKLCTTLKGSMGMVLETTIVGDRITILFGSRSPVVLRHKGDAYQLVGSCFLDGLMKGEAMG